MKKIIHIFFTGVETYKHEVRNRGISYNTHMNSYYYY